MYTLKNEEICHCMKVTDMDIEHALSQSTHIGQVEGAFADVQAMTKCSTGCGGCYERILDIIADMMHR